MNSFADFGLLSSLQKSLKEKNIVRPTEIQLHAIPQLMSGKSVVGISETGSGKTLAYALPLLHALKSLEDAKDPVTEERKPRAIVLVPTRELGDQVSKVFKSLSHDTRLRVRPALGGMALEQARRNVSGAFEILLATPGRLIQLLDLELVDLSDVRMVIFDEADQMMDQGFLPDSKFIVEQCGLKPQLGLFSATVSKEVQVLLDSLFPDTQVVKSSGSGKVVKSLVTKNLKVIDGKRWPIFEKVLTQPVNGGTIVFTNTREQCDKLAKELTDRGYLCAVYRGDMDQNDRRQNFKKFREGKIDLLIATDLAGRGLDMESVARVVNFHLPQQMENYLHRVGRTARAGRTGLVVNLVTERDSRLMAALEGKKPEAIQHKPTLNRDTRPKASTKSAKTDHKAKKDGKKASEKSESSFHGKKPAERKGGKRKLGFQKPSESKARFR